MIKYLTKYKWFRKLLYQQMLNVFDNHSNIRGLVTLCSAYDIALLNIPKRSYKKCF